MHHFGISTFSQWCCISIFGKSVQKLHYGNVVIMHIHFNLLVHTKSITWLVCEAFWWKYLVWVVNSWKQLWRTQHKWLFNSLMHSQSLFPSALPYSVHSDSTFYVVLIFLERVHFESSTWWSFRTSRITSRRQATHGEWDSVSILYLYWNAFLSWCICLYSCVYLLIVCLPQTAIHHFLISRFYNCYFVCQILIK